MLPCAAATGSLKLWRRDLDRLQSNLKEKELEISQKNDQIDVLKSSLHNVQEKSKDKIDVRAYINVSCLIP